MPFNLVIKPDTLIALGRALKAEDDGKQLKKDLLRNLRQALKPVQDEVKREINSMGSHGGEHGMALRRTVARKVVVQTRMSGRSAGVRLIAKKTPGLRGFRNAPKRLNSKKGWRHPVMGDREDWVHQMGKPDWFDGPVRARRSEFRKAVADVLDEMADRIRRRVR
jgi:hypothetical protein